MSFLDSVLNAGGPLCAPLAGFPGIALTNSTVRENLTDPVLQARTLIAMHRAVNFDIVFPMMDLTVEAHALGANVDWEIDELPAVTGIRVETMADAESLPAPEIGQGNRLDVFVETCRLLKRTFPEKPVWAYVLGPFSITGRLMGMTEIAIAVKLEPELVHAVLRKCNDLLLTYSSALLDTGVDGLMVLEPASGMLCKDDGNNFSNFYVKEIVDMVRKRGRTSALHNCGNIGHLVESLCATGIEVLHVGSVSDPSEIYPRVPKNIVLMGNLDPTEVFLRGTPAEVEGATRKLSDRMADCERFVMSSGCDLPPGVSIENLQVFQRAACGEYAGIQVS